MLFFFLTINWEITCYLQILIFIGTLWGKHGGEYFNYLVTQKMNKKKKAKYTLKILLLGEKNVALCP